MYTHRQIVYVISIQKNNAWIHLGELQVTCNEGPNPPGLLFGDGLVSLVVSGVHKENPDDQMGLSENGLHCKNALKKQQKYI